MKKGGGANKGASFERKMAKRLSMWVTNNERDDVFHRSIGSGGWAGVRSRKGKSATTNHGDLQAIDKVGEPFISLVTVEIKKGYGKWSAMDVIDQLPKKPNQKKRALQDVEKFLTQAMEQTENSPTAEYPMIIAQRDGRKPVVIVESRLVRDIHDDEERFCYGCKPRSVIFKACKMNWRLFSLEAFLNWVYPGFFTNAWNAYLVEMRKEDSR